MTTTSETTNTALPLNPNSVNLTNMGFSNNAAVATADKASISIVPLIQPSDAIYNNLTPSLVYQPKAHSYLEGSSTSALLVDSTLVDNLNSNNYTTIDLDINDELVSLEINKDISLIENINIAAAPLVNSVSFNSISWSFWQYDNYAYFFGAQNGPFIQVTLNSDGTLGQFTTLSSPTLGGNLTYSDELSSYGNNGFIYKNTFIGFNFIGASNTIDTYFINHLGMSTTATSSLALNFNWGAYPSTFVINDTIYFLFSVWLAISDSNSNIYTATMTETSNGITLSDFANTTLTYPLNNTYYNSIAINDVYYFFTNGQAEVYTTTVDATTGDLNGFELAGTLPENYRVGNSLLDLNGTLYIFGVGSGYNEIWVGTQNSDNSLTFAVSTLQTPVPVLSCPIAVSSTNVYILGSATTNNTGFGSGLAGNEVTSIKYSGGTLLSVQPIITLPSVLSNMGMLSYNDYVYILGGVTATNTPTGLVAFTYVNTQNGPGATITGTNLPIAVYDAMFINIGATVYMLGGNNGTDILNSIYTGQIQSNGNITGWTLSTETLPYAIAGGAVTYTDSNIYIIGGYNYPSGSTTQTPVATVINIPLTSTAIGTPIVANNTLPQAIYYCSAVNTNGLIYVAGGLNSSNTALTNVYNSLINEDGTINGFGDTGNNLPSNYGAGQLTMWNNFLYYFGGTTGELYQAYVGSNYFGVWNKIQNALPTQWTNMGAIVCNNYLFGVGGANDGTFLNNVYYYTLTDNNYYSLVPTSELSALPNSIYLLGNLEAQGLVGDLTSGESLATLETNSRGISNATVTYEFNPIFAADQTAGGNIYYQINNLNEGDVVQTLAGTIGGTILPASTGTTSTTTTSSSS